MDEDTFGDISIGISTFHSRLGYNARTMRVGIQTS